MICEIVRHIQRNKRLYSLVIIEVTIAISTMVYSMNHMLSGMEDLRDNFLHVADYSIQIEIWNQEQNKNNWMTSKVIEHINNMCGRNLRAVVYSPQVYFLQSNSVDFNYLFINDTQVGSAEVFLSDELLNKLTSPGQFIDSALTMGAGYLIYQGVKYTIIPMPEEMSEEVILIDETGQSVGLKDSIVFSLDNGCAYDDFLSSGEPYLINLTLDQNVLGMDENTIPKVIDELESASGNSCRITARDLRKANEKLDKYMLLIPGYFGKVGVIVTLITIIGISEIIKLILRKRYREIAITIALGKDRKKISAELVAEIAVVTLAGTIIGMMIGTLLTVNIPFNTYFTIELHLATFIWAILIQILVLCASVITSIIDIKRLKPSELFRWTH